MISRKLLITEYFGKLPFHYDQTFSKSDKINLTEGNKIISNEGELCRLFKKCFSKTVDELKIPSISN